MRGMRLIHVETAFVLVFFAIVLDPSSPNPTSEMAPSSRGSTETVKAPSDTSLSPIPRTAEKEVQKDGEVEAPREETEEAKAIRLLYCSLCKVAVNSASQLQAHNSGERQSLPWSGLAHMNCFCTLLIWLYIPSGTKHKTMLEARSGDGAIKSFPRMGVKAKMAAPSESSTGLQNKTFHCEICDVHVNSETQLKQVSWTELFFFFTSMYDIQICKF